MKNKNYFFELLHTTHNIKMNKRTMDDILKTFDYVLVRNGTVYVKNGWYEYWVKIPVEEVEK